MRSRFIGVLLVRLLPTRECVGCLGEGTRAQPVTERSEVAAAAENPPGLAASPCATLFPATTDGALALGLRTVIDGETTARIDYVYAVDCERQNDSGVEPDSEEASLSMATVPNAGGLPVQPRVFRRRHRIGKRSAPGVRDRHPQGQRPACGARSAAGG